MDLQCKRELVQKAKLCYNCLRPSHSVKNCASKSVCRVGGCKQRHHTLLCPKIENSSDRKEERSDDPKQPTQPSRDPVDVVSSLVVQVPKPLKETFVLPTALINVKAVDGGFLRCRALIDSGSGASLITEACVNKLGIPRTNGKVVVSGLAQQSAGTTRGIVKLVIANRCNEAVILRSSAFVMGKLTSTLPAQLVKPNSKLLQKEIQDALADPAYNQPAPVDIILGADVFLAILQPGQVKDEFENPVAQNTIFGWIVCGNQSIYTAGVPSNVSIINLHTEVDVNRTLRQFWEQEEVPKSQQLAPEEQAAVECFRSTTTRDDSGRFIVRLPFDESKPALGESLTPAIKRMRAMENRFERDPVFHRQYFDFVDEYLALGHMEEVPANDLSMAADKCFYLPHHAVMKADSSTTKLRVVFDASSSSESGISLNDRLLAGPNINQDLFDVHLRFRSNEIAFAADAEKMFRQVWVHPQDRDFQRVVWRSDPGEPIKHFRLCTVTYGTKPAPYLAIESMREAARNYETVYPEAAQRIVLDMYVDDFMSGAKNIDEARQMKVQVCEILRSAGFNLRKWTTNRPDLLSDNEYTEQVPVEIKLAEQPEAVKALGIQWLPKDDVFSFKVSLSVDSVNTKRQLLSDSSRLFDPYGWLFPVMVKIKILFQQLWLSDVSWDDPLPASVEVPWKDIKEGLHLLEQIRVPRYMVSFGGKVQLHGFSDASEMAYGAVIYSRARHDAGNIFVNLVAAKTRVAPIKQVSLPRLELSAAALLAELMQRVTQALSHLTVEHWAWTDNTIVLQWLSSHPRRWKTYVANRTSAILNFLPRERWNHVSSQDNPADCASRGLSPGEFVSFDLWFLGPEWLRQDEEFWNAEPYEPIVDEDSLEERKLKALHTLPISCRSNYAVELELLHRRSSYRLVVRALAYVNRFLQAARGVQHEPTLTPIEIDSARLQLARAAQFDVFKQEMEILAKTGELPIKNRLSALHPFLDDSGTMRNSPYSFNVKHPVILPRDHRLTELLLRDLHLQNLHAGPTLLTATVNQQYWVVGLQTAVRRTVRSCIRCVRLKGQTANQLMGSLPVSRVMATRAFTHVGVDYAGPFKIHALCVREVKTSKDYLAVFVCMATKAVHLEAASDLSSRTFIAALKRFIGRRGYPNEIWSDNGTNFVGTDNWLQDLQRSFRNNSRAVDHFLTNQGIKWIFNPPSAPHRGGIWEAAVKNAKKHILAVVGSEPITFEEFTTVLSQVEACLNSRPVCALSSNPDSYEALTPGHFLVGQPLNLIPEPGVRHIPVNRLDRWQALQKHTEEIWRRWREEYVATLQPRTKWRTTEENVKENQLVLVKNENVPPAQWELARIVKLHPDPSGIVRTVTLRRGQIEYQRPVQKVCVLLSD
ncbi:uncharacterized protein LOC115269273 [Aedes albopictus]|uniref:Integrase catalytic domain-containing protein n=1 Tax=Aedes albopictus TaxID=7160 RepID=A0ABM1Z6T3_AEDAL